MMAREVKFVTDAPLEGTRFEPSVPPRLRVSACQDVLGRV
jgi:hypothetical protein